VDTAQLFSDIKQVPVFSFGNAFTGAAKSSENKEETAGASGGSSAADMSASLGVELTPPPSAVKAVRGVPESKGEAVLSADNTAAVRSKAASTLTSALDRLGGACASGDLPRVLALLSDSASAFPHSGTLTSQSSVFKLQTVYNDSTGRSPLYYAAGKGHLQVVQALLERHPLMVGVPNKFGTCALSWACFNGHEAVVRCLLSRGGKAGINEPSKAGDKALTSACVRGHLPIVELLLQEGADPDFTDNDGCSPLYRTCVAKLRDDDTRIAIVNALLARLRAHKAPLDKNTLCWAAVQPTDRAAQQIQARK
jgi:hypothetical protein